MFDKNITCDKFSVKDPSLVAYDEHLLFYEKLITEIEQIEINHDIHCVR